MEKKERILLANIFSIVKKFDVIISMLDYSFMPTVLLAHSKYKKRLVLWGIGVAASYKIRYDSLEIVRKKICKLINLRFCFYVFLIILLLHLGQVISIFPLFLGTLKIALHLLHLK